MNVLNTVNGLVVNLIMEVLFGDLLAELLSPVHPLESLTLLQRRRVDVLLLGESECEDAIEELLQQFVKFFLLVVDQCFVDDIRDEFLLQDDQ